MMIIVILIGCIFIFLGMKNLFSCYKKRRNCTETTRAMIKDIYIGDEISDKYPIYEYAVGEKIYVNKSNIRDSSVHIGRFIKIYYNPNNPNEFFADGDHNIFYIVWSIIFVLAGLYCIFGWFI